jgi:hypothetical protein
VLVRKKVKGKVLFLRIYQQDKDQYTCFYIAFCVFDDEEEEEQQSMNSGHGNNENSDTE